MISLLNRISWILSIVFGFILALLLRFFLGFGGSYIREGIAYFTVIVGFIFCFIIKAMFFSQNHISETVIEYSHKLVIKAGGKGIKNESNQEDKTSQEYKVPYVNLDEISEDENEEELEDNIIRNNNSFAERVINSSASYNEKIEEEEYIQKPEVPREPNFIEKFFAENALAKIGGIILFLGVLFFLGLIYTSVGPVQKVIIGFVTGFVFFGIGVVLDQKGYKSESRTMLGLGILVNYLVILSGRYLIGEGNPIISSDVAIINQNTSNVLTEGTTFLFLILNTVFAVVTSLVYKSKTLLLFSFVFAYLNPFLIGSAGNGTPYTLVGYSVIVSFGAMILSYLYNKDDDKEFARYLNYVAFIGGNILLLLAPFTVASQWLLKLIFLGIISLSSIFLSYNNDDKDNIGLLFVMSYIAFAILLIRGGQMNVLHTGIAFLGYITFVLVALASSIFLITVGSLVSISYILFAPLILIFALLVTGSLFYIVPVIIGSLFIYLIIFSFIYETVSAGFKYVFFALLCIFLVLSNFSLKFVIPSGMDNITHLSVIVSSLVFLFAAYYFSGKEKLEYLYSIGTIGTIFLLIPIIETTKVGFVQPSVIAIIVFALANILSPFINRNLCSKDLKNLAISLVAGIIFIGGELYNYGEIAKLFSGITLGYCFMGLAVLYFILGYLMMNILEIEFNTSSLSNNEDKKNAIFGYLGVSISLFSIAILIMFSKQPAIIASIWFFESTILYFFFSRIKDFKIFLGALILFVIGIFRYGTFIGDLKSGEFDQLIPIVAIFISFILNLKFLEKTEEGTKVAHDILHLIAMAMVGIGVLNIVPHTGHGFSVFAISIVLVIIGFCYNLFASVTLKYAFAIVLGIFYFYHISSLDNIYRVLVSESKTNLKALQYGVVAILGAGLYFRSAVGGKFDDIKKMINIPYFIYVFMITTMFVYDLTNHNTFSITIYWALWAFAYISNGISNDKQTRRTIGLYILTGVIAKIFLYDIIFGTDSGLVRVIALLFVGGLMIVMSMFYTRKYSGSLLGEFKLSNLSSDSPEEEPKKDIPNVTTSFVVNEKISQIDIGDISMVTFQVNSGKIFKIKSKNLIKIAKLVEKNTGKLEFQRNELKSIYTFVLNNYQSELNPADFKKIIEVMKDFIEEGGKVIFE